MSTSVIPVDPLMGAPSTEMITSPTLSPAAAAGPLETTRSTRAPFADRDATADSGAGQAAGTTELQHRDVLRAVVTDHVHGVRLTGADGERTDIGSCRDHVIIGQHDAARIDHDAGSGPYRVVVT